MQKFHIKSILLGIGMGIIITSILSMIYLAGINPESNISKEKVIELAKKYGMVENTGFVNNEGAGNNKKEENKNNTPEQSKPAESTPKEPVKPVEPVQPEIRAITVEPGDSSEVVAAKLLKAGLINDKSAFIKELSNMELSDEINIGDFKIKSGTDIKGIIRMITKTN